MKRRAAYNDMHTRNLELSKSRVILVSYFNDKIKHITETAETWTLNAMNIIARVARSGVFIFILIFRVIVRRKEELVLMFHPLCSRIVLLREN